MSDPTDTHQYWGSARDRIPRSQTDPLAPAGHPEMDVADGSDTRGRLVQVRPHDNLCLLRSGQDWTETQGEERAFYLSEVQPKLEAGMLEIRDEGPRLGCYFNRYVTVTENGRPIEKTYSVSAWHSLSALEVWAKEARTHQKIFGSGIAHYTKAAEAEGGAKLYLYHEMMVVRAQDQSFTYYNCHNRTGMLRARLMEHT